MIRDITERKSMRRELYESEARYQTIFHGIDLGILLLDLDGNILTCNPALLRIIGTTQTEMRRKTLQNLVHPASIKENLNHFREVVSGERDHLAAESRFLNQQQQEMAVKLTLSLARDQNGDPHYVIGIIENITAQKQMEAELVEVERKMVDVGEAERLHLAQELHDGPLQDLYAVMYQLKLLQEVPSSPEKPSQEMDRIRDMLQHIINLLRTTTGDLRPPTLAYFGLSKAIQSHAETLQEIYPGLDFLLELTNDQNKLTQRVRMGLFRIYQHCIINVVRHAQASKVVIRFELTSTRVMLEVHDNGMGFRVPKQWIDLVREGHFGLVGAAERAVSIGGDLKIRSVEGKGTIVRVVVPRREEDQKQKARFPFQVSDLSPSGDDWPK
jgi:PAS domain S-box-containing protein